MQVEILKALLTEVYAAFGKTAPSEGSTPFQSIYRRINDGNVIPDECAQDLAFALCEYDSLPINLGKAIRSEYYKWQLQHPGKFVKRQSCPQCGKRLTGYVWLNDGKGRNIIARCQCNTWDDSMPIATPEFLAATGLQMGLVINPFPPSEGDMAQGASDLISMAFEGARQADTHENEFEAVW